MYQGGKLPKESILRGKFLPMTGYENTREIGGKGKKEQRR